MQVQRAHACEHGVLHGASEIGFSDQCLLRLNAPAGVSPGSKQHPHRQHAERTDQPEKTAADHTQRSPVALSPNQQSVAYRRYRDFVFGRSIRPGQQSGGFAALRRQSTGKQLALVIQQGHSVFGADFGRNSKSKQAVQGVLANDNPHKAPLFVHRHMQLQRACFVAGIVL